MVKKIVLIIIVLIFILPLVLKTKSEQKHATWWDFQSIDTMKYSRDIAREKLTDSSFDPVIKEQVANIAETGATHIGVATPYDEEFYPFLKRWVDEARRNGLNVWFRGNFSGWEEWFNYEKIDRSQHIKKTEDFILSHPEIFENGDVFSACPECENGGPGDPRHNGDAAGHKKFLIDEYKVTKDAFKKIGKEVASNYISMNGDVAKLIMDRETTKALDGIVTIDHYVRTPEQLVSDIEFISEVSGGKVVLGEFGAPIPDIHGNFTEEEQDEWLRNALIMLVSTEELVGLNYWTNTGSSTELWRGDGTPRLAKETLKSFYKAEVIKGRVFDEASWGIGNATLSVGGREYNTKNSGEFEFPYFEHQESVKFEAPGFFSKEVEPDSDEISRVILKRENEDIWFKIRKFFNNFFGFLK